MRDARHAVSRSDRLVSGKRSAVVVDGEGVVALRAVDEPDRAERERDALAIPDVLQHGKAFQEVFDGEIVEAQIAVAHAEVGARGGSRGAVAETLVDLDGTAIAGDGAVVVALIL